MTIKSDAWVLYAGEKGAPPTPTQLVRETFEFSEPGPEEALVSPLYGCMEGNMKHAVERKPIDLCLARGEAKVVIGNAGVVRVDKVGPGVSTVREGDNAIVFCCGVPDKFGYPERIWAYDAPGTIGVLSRQTRMHQKQLIPIPKNSAYPLEQWAAFSLRYVTAWSNWELAYGTLRLLLNEKELPHPEVWGWGGGVSLGELALAKHYGCKVAQIASTDERLTTIESLGILIFHREIKIEIVDDFFSGIIILSWKKFERYIKEMREIGKRETYYEWVQWLAEQFQKRESRMPAVPSYIAHKDWKE